MLSLPLFSMNLFHGEPQIDFGSMTSLLLFMRKLDFIVLGAWLRSAWLIVLF